MKRCDWVPKGNRLYEEYHDKEWGVPVYEDQTLFEFLILEGAQAGLSWETILKRREGYRELFANFDPYIVASYTKEDVERLRLDARIIRNRKKIESAIKNAQCFLEIVNSHGSFSSYFWDYTEGLVIQSRLKTIKEAPVQTELSQKISKDLKKRGFSFVGPTIIYAYMQAVGMVNDHTVDCDSFALLEKN